MIVMAHKSIFVLKGASRCVFLGAADCRGMPDTATAGPMLYARCCSILTPQITFIIHSFLDGSFYL